MNGFPTTLLLTMIALAIVLVAAWIILRGIASMGKFKQTNGRIKITESVPVGPKERIVLLEIDGQSVLIGVSAGGLMQIDPTLASPLPVARDDTPSINAESHR